MAFKQIGTLARTVLVKAELAAQGHDAARKFEGGAAMPGGATATPPVTLYGRGGPERNVNEKDGGSLATPASARFRGDSRREGDGAPPVRLNLGLRVVSTTCEPTHRPNSGRPIRRVGSHLVLVSSHSPTHEMRSGTA
jgi:hypothetical protein